MRCHECGTQNPPNFTFCVYCNSELEETQEENINRGYLVCSGCESYYKLQEGEYPEDFYSVCECGGRLHYYRYIEDFLSRSKRYAQLRDSKKLKRHEIVFMVIIAIILAFLIYNII